jgi:hypothetical protein
MTLRRHRGKNRLRQYQRLVVTDGGAKPDDVRCAVFVNAGDDRDPSFMLGLHGQKNKFGMIGPIPDVRPKNSFRNGRLPFTMLGLRGRV